MSRGRQLIVSIITLVILLGVLAGIPFYKEYKFNKEKKQCSYETIGYVESVDVQSETHETEDGTSTKFHNTINCVFEYEGKEYRASSSFDAKMGVSEESREITIYVDPGNQSHILTEEQHEIIRIENKRYFFIAKFAGIFMGIVVLINLIQVLIRR